MNRNLPLVSILAIAVFCGCAVREPVPPPDCGFVEPLSGEDWLTLALRLYDDPARAGELAALNSSNLDDVPPSTIVAPIGYDTAQPPIYETLEADSDDKLERAVLRLWARDDTAGALALLRDALEPRPRQPHARYLLGLIHARRGELRRAAAELEAARYLAPADARSHAALALIHAELGRYADARRYAFSALQLDWYNWQLHYLMGLLAAREGERRLAEGHLFLALDLGPTYGPERERLLELLALLQSDR